MATQAIILNEQDIQLRVQQLAVAIDQRYRESNQVVVIVLLKGAKRFADDLLRQAHIDFRVEYLRVHSYEGNKTSGAVNIEGEITHSLRGREVLVIDDIYDTGLTLHRVVDYIKRDNPKSIRICTLLEKEVSHIREVKIDFLGFKVPNFFLIGYGLDHNEKYRELPYIGSLCEVSA